MAELRGAERGKRDSSRMIRAMAQRSLAQAAPFAAQGKQDDVSVRGLWLLCRQDAGATG